MSTQQGSGSKVPVAIYKKGTTSTKGKYSRKDNIAAAKLIVDVVKNSLGPRGMDKMLVDTMGDVTITNDGATILKEIDVQHPAAKMMIEISKATDSEVGDGTTSAVILAGALIEKADELISKDVHPTIIVDGYRKSATKAIEILNNIAQKIDRNDKQILTKVAETSMYSKLVSDDSPILSQIVVNAIMQVAEKTEGIKGLKVDLDNIKVEKKAGGSIHDTKLIKGIVLDKEVVHAGMPKRIENARIALLNSALEIEKTSAEIRINDAQRTKFLEEETKTFKSIIDKIESAGANVLVCQKGIDDVAQYYLAKANVLAVYRVKGSDMIKLSMATGSRIVNNLEDLTQRDLGSANLVEERKVETDKWVFIEGSKNPKSVTILIRGGSQRVVDEASRSVHDALMVVKDVLEKPAVVAGGGAPETYIAEKLREWANALSGREQLAVHKFADALDSIPLALAENAGMDPIDTMTDLRAKQGKRGKWIGVDVRNTTVVDMFKHDVLEPLVVKEQIIKSATEAASMILRIDDVITVPKSSVAQSIIDAIPPDVGEMGGMGAFEEVARSSPKNIQIEEHIKVPLPSHVGENARKSDSEENPKPQGIRHQRILEKNNVGHGGDISIINPILNRQDLKEFDSARRIAIENMQSKPQAFRYYLNQNRKYLLNSLEHITEDLLKSIDTSGTLSKDQHTVLMFLDHLEDRIKENDERSIEELSNEFLHFKRQAAEITSRVIPKLRLDS